MNFNFFAQPGKEDHVLEARRRLANDFQSHGTCSLSVPRENYRFILGKSGAKLQDLEKRTGAKITVPKIDSDPNETIQIKGAKESIEKAVHEIQLICSEAMSNCKETILVDREYHPFIVGPFGETLAHLQQESGAKINVPPPSVNKNDIIITGEQNAVNKAKQLVLDIYEQKKADCTTCSMVIKKAQHKYIIGPKGSALNEFFKTTGVSIEMPTDPESEQIVLRAEQDKMGPALSLLYEKAHYVVEAEITVQDWVQKHLLGKKGAHFSQLQAEFPNVQVSFQSESSLIKMHGPRQEIEKAKEVFKREVEQITSQIKVKDLEVEPRFHRYIIGKAGVHINKIRDETGAKIHMPNEGSENDKRIRSEGSEEAIEKASEMLNEIIQKAIKMEAEVSQDLNIEQRLHRQIIGSKGEKIREIRERFNVFITFPEPSVRSDRVSIRGEKEGVEECHKHLTALNKQLVNDNYRIELPINKQFHRAIIGKEGSKIKKIRAETQTKIDLPSEDSASNVIVVSGKKDNVERARELIQEIEQEELNLVQQDIIIPNKFHNSIIGKNGRLIRAIMQDCDNVSINFPQEGSQSDKVSIRGTKEGVAKAKKQLIDLSKDRQLNGHEEPVPCPRQFHGYFLGKSGRGGAKLYQLRNQYDVRIIVPDETEAEVDNSITLVGKKENTLKAKKELQELIVSLQNTVESSVQVPQKYHFNFIARKGQLIRQIEEDNNNVNISFPGKNATENPETVVLKGGKEFVEAAKARILEIVHDLDAQITLDVEIEQVHHKHVMGARGGNLFPLEQKYNVKIKFPKKESEDTPPPETDEERRAVNIVQITGRQENCEKAAEELLSFLPVTIALEVPFEFHGSIIGQKGQFLRSLRDQYRVDVRIPPSEDQNNEITISGSKTEVEYAKEAILDRLKTLEEEKVDREARNYRQELVVPREYHNKIIGKKGATIQEIRKACQVRISLPEKRNTEFSPEAVEGGNGEPTTEAAASDAAEHSPSVEGEEEDHSQDTIVIVGYEKNVKNAVKRITKIVRDLQSQVIAQVKVNPENYSQLIGARGKTINKIMEQFKVNIKLPRDGSDNVTIAGNDKNVEACKAHILEMVGSFVSRFEIMKVFVFDSDRVFFLTI